VSESSVTSPITMFNGAAMINNNFSSDLIYFEMDFGAFKEATTKLCV
jgi:hypothetical protein